jgi:large conductance mechanosensitive channel
MGMIKEFKEFAVKGNVVDMAVGIIIGAAFGKIVSTLVEDVLMPPIGWAMRGIDFSKLEFMLSASPGDAANVTIRYGLFINAVINFTIVAFAMFLVVKQINRFREQPAPAPTTKDCPYCKMSIPIGATRCGHCTAELK